MKRFLLLPLFVLTTLASLAQDNVNKKLNRAADHFMFQVSYDTWLGVPDSIKSAQKGFNRGFNAYFMLDKPFKSNSNFSIGFGVGVSTSHVFFKKMELDIKSLESTLPFISKENDEYYKKYKLSTTHVEIPIELRFMDKPKTPNKSIKAALGVKIGTLLKAQTKGKELRDASGNTIVNYTHKESSKVYFNSTRISATGRIGYGIVSLFGSYSFNNLFKDGVAAEINPLQIGITISGL
jgi:hypothetical protein